MPIIPSESKEVKEPDPVFTPGSESAESREALGLEVGPDSFDIVDRMLGTLQDDLLSWGKKAGYTSDQMNLFMGAFEDELALNLNSSLADGKGYQQRVSKLVQFEGVDPDPNATFVAGDFRGTFGWYYSPEGLEKLVDDAWTTLQTKWSGLGDRSAISRGGTGRAGSRKPTATEIRNQFDLDQLTNSVNDIWRVMLLEEHDNPRKLASDYVEAIVRTGAEKTIDFETFVRERARKTARHASIFRNKPESESEESLIQRYYQSAMNILRPNNAAEVAIGGAQFGADAATFSARLGRSKEVTGSAPFITGLENRMSDLKGLFRG